MVAITRIEPELLMDRLDGRYNNPNAVQIRREIVKSGLPTKRVCDILDLACGPFGSTLTADQHMPDGEVLLVQPTNISEDQFTTKSSWRISKEILDKKGLKTYKPGTLLFARVGVYPHIGVLPNGAGLATISSSMIAGVPEDETDTRYLSAFFKCRFGFLLLLAAQKVTAQPTIGTSEIGVTEVAYPNTLAQKYIGDKVRQAEKLWAWSKIIRKEIDYLASNGTIYAATLTTNDKHNLPKLSDLTDRLDPKYYDKRGVAVQRAARSLGDSLSRLVLNITNGFEERNFVDDGIKYITVSEVSSGRLDVSKAPKISADIDVPDKAKINEKCVLVVRTGSVGSAAKADFRDCGAAISSDFVRIEFEDEATAAAVAVFLNSSAGKILQHKISYGAVQPHIGHEELLALPIPNYVLDLKDHFLALTHGFEDAFRASQALSIAARQLVEALIERQITEAQLIEAENALEKGDDSLDRAILSRLKTDGMDGKGDPLFPYIDRLYELLEQATQESEE